MKHKTLRTLLCVILTVCFCLSAIVPASAAGLFGGESGIASAWDQWIRSLKDRFTDTQSGTEETTPVVQTATGNDAFYRIVHLDCGRKYFSKDWIIALLYEMKNDDYNQLQLAFGNDGLRFLLDDMSFTANGTTYSHDTVVSKVEAGNKAQNSSGDARWLTETEMDEIIAKANELGIEIVPLLNLPGHANAILDIANDAYNASGSNNTLNVAGGADTAAANFGYALFTKYVDYFAGKDCKFFNFGADEYANDASGTFSFSRLNSTQYQNFTRFIAKLTSYIETKGMTARSFNDGLYYNGQSVASDAADTIKGIQCCYWSSGWGSYPVASASTISEKGHSMINTNGDFYYVLGKSDKFDSNYDYADNFSNTAFMGSTISNPVGSMFCIWCDYPNAETETEVAQKTRLVLRAMGQRMQGNSITGMDTTTVVTNGFNADGTINGATREPDPIPQGETINLVYNGDPATRTVSGDQTGNVNRDKLNENIATVDVQRDYAEGKTEKVLGSKITFSADGTYEGVFTDYNGHYLIINADGSVSSTDKINDATEITVTRETTGLFSRTTTYKLYGNGKYLYTEGRNGSYTLKAGSTENTWSYSSTSGYVNNSRYLTYSNGFTLSRNSGNVHLYSTTTETTTAKDDTVITFTPVFPGTTYVTVGGVEYTIIVAYKQENVNVVTGATKNITVSGTLDTTELDTSVATVVVSGTTMTITAVANGTTSVKVGGVQYNITVEDEDLSAVTPLTVEYWITNKNTYSSAGATNQQVSAALANVNSEDGVEFNTIVPNVTYEKTDGTGTNYYIWKGTRLTSGNEQTATDGVDQTAAGNDFYYIRYWDGVWSFSVNCVEWTEFNSDDQIVAYYLQKTDVTKEIPTYVKDWGFDTSGKTPDWSGGLGQVALTLAVVYLDGTVSPAEGDMYANSTTIFNYWNDRDIGIVAPVNNSDYTIAKITVTDGSRAENSTADVWDSTDTIKWKKITLDDGTQWYNETEVWNKDSGTTPMVNGKAGTTTEDGITWSAKNTGKLVLIYLETVEKETNLNVVYWDNNIGQKINTDNKQISMKYTAGDPEPTYFNSLKNMAVPTKDGYFTLDDDAYVTNSSNVNQTFNKKLSTVQNVPDSYRTGLYEYVGAEIQDGGKTLVLHYNIDSDKLTKSYVIDFGSPVTIPASDFMENIDSIKSVNILQNSKYGTVEKRNNNTELLYTPTKPVDAVDTIKVEVTYSDNTNETFTIGIVPATNVYYEETFMTPSGSNSWGTPTAPTTQQTTELGGEKTYVYGYEQSLVAGNTTNYSGNSAYVANLTLPADKKSVYTKDNLTFSFTGAGFDLISECGKDTGMVVVRLENANTKEAKVYIIDTYFQGDDTILNNTHNIYQTPVIRELTLEYGTYNVTIRGALYKNSGTVVNQPAAADVSTYSMQASAFAVETEAFDIRAFLDDCGFEDASVDDVELVYMDENSVLNGGTGIQSETIAPVERSAAFSTYAMNAETEAASSTEARVTIDGFRVYNPLKDGSDVYTTDKESGVKYNDLSEYIQSNSTTGTLPTETGTKNVMYVEYKSELRQAESANYNSKPFGTNGPKYEIYLAPNCGIAVGLPDDFTENDILQLSAKIVSGTPTLKIGKNGGSFKEITVGNSTAGLSLTGTEMYYDISDCIQKTNDGKKFITIINGTTATEEKGNQSVLAVNVLKMSEKKATNEMSEETQNYILASLTESMATPIDDTFEPEVFEVYAPTTARRNRTFSISANVSVTDLEKVTIAADNGTETELNALNRVSVKWGISSEYYYLKTFRMRDSGEHTFKITAYGKDGSSVSKTVTVLVK